MQYWVINENGWVTVLCRVDGVWKKLSWSSVGYWYPVEFGCEPDLSLGGSALETMEKLKTMACGRHLLSTFSTCV